VHAGDLRPVYSRDRSDGLLARVGVPLADVYLEFLGGRLGAPTAVAATYSARGSPLHQRVAGNPLGDGPRWGYAGRSAVADTGHWRWRTERPERYRTYLARTLWESLVSVRVVSMISDV
jgi:hypothetical protein